MLYTLVPSVFIIDVDGFKIFVGKLIYLLWNSMHSLLPCMFKNRWYLLDVFQNCT